MDDWEEKFHGFHEPGEDRPEHNAAVGRVLAGMNGIDLTLTWVLLRLIGADQEKGRVFAGGLSTSDLLWYIQRLAQKSDVAAEKIKEFDEVTRQIRAYKSVRDNVAHQVWAVSGEKMSFSNYWTARDQTAATFLQATYHELNEMARYSRHLSQRVLEIFPDTVSRIGGLQSVEVPKLLRKSS